jgi:iron complex outermembrane receptor protein
MDTKKRKKNLWGSSALMAVLAGASVATPAVAQQTDPAPAEGQNNEAATTTTTEEDIVVTGSRIRRNEFTSTAPVQIITSEATTLEGMIDPAEVLQTSTVASGSQQINNQFTGFVTEGGPGAQTISLRGLGANRTLVLLNGRRLNPAGTRGQVVSVDLNTLPGSIIDRYEILKDGASSVYGSDAVAGVVNAITRTNLDGAQVGGSLNMPFDGGGESYNVEGSFGNVFDRGHFMAAFDYTRIENLNWGDRDYLSCAEDYVFNPTTFQRIDILENGKPKCFNLLSQVADRLGTTFPGTSGRFTPDPTATAGGGQFGLDLAGWRRVGLTVGQVANRLSTLNAGGIFPTILATSTTLASSSLNDAQRAAIEAAWRASQAAVPTNPPIYGTRNAISPSERLSLYFDGSFDLTAGQEIYGELLYNRRESSQDSLRQIFPNVAATNPNNPFGVTSRSIVTIQTDQNQSVDYFRSVAGIRGDTFVDGWKYDLYVQYGKSDAEYTGLFVYNDRVNATVGTTGCNQALITISGGQCSALPANGVNWFNPNTILTGNYSAAETAFLFGRETGTTEYTQTLANGTLSGDLFELPAGPVGVALGFEWRKEEIDDTPGFNARNNNYWGSTTAGRTAGEDTVRELFGEASVPILRGWRLAESLTVDGSYRWTDYDSYGDDSTYKAGVNWQITPQYRVRATQGTSFRAPALYEMFLANQSGFLSQTSIDPCQATNLVSQTNPIIIANCNAVVPGGVGPASFALILTGGGGKGVLEAETSDAQTVGFIWTPSFTNLSVAIDYFKIQVDNQVSQFGAGNIIGACMSDPNYPNNPFCSLFTRFDSSSTTPGAINTVQNAYVNLNKQNTTGMDLTVRWQKEFSFGRFTADLQSTWTFDDEITFRTGTAPEDFNGEIIDPDFTANLDLRFDKGDWTYFWNVDMIGKASNTEDFGGDVFGYRSSGLTAYYKQYTEFTAVHDASIRYRSNDWTIIAGVQDIFDEQPPAISTGTAFSRIGTVTTGAYDIRGRRGFVEVQRRF